MKKLENKIFLVYNRDGHIERVTGDIYIFDDVIICTANFNDQYLIFNLENGCQIVNRNNLGLQFNSKKQLENYLKDIFNWSHDLIYYNNQSPVFAKYIKERYDDIIPSMMEDYISEMDDNSDYFLQIEIMTFIANHI